MSIREVSKEKTKLKVYVWYHSYDIVTEKPITSKVEREIEIEMPSDFEQRMLSCSIEGKSYDKEFSYDFGWSEFEKPILDLKLESGYSRVLIELPGGMFWRYLDIFAHNDSNFIDLSSTANLEIDSSDKKGSN